MANRTYVCISSVTDVYPYKSIYSVTDVYPYKSTKQSLSRLLRLHMRIQIHGKDLDDVTVQLKRQDFSTFV